MNDASLTRVSTGAPARLSRLSLCLWLRAWPWHEAPPRICCSAGGPLPPLLGRSVFLCEEDGVTRKAGGPPTVPPAGNCRGTPVFGSAHCRSVVLGVRALGAVGPSGELSRRSRPRAMAGVLSRGRAGAEGAGAVQEQPQGARHGVGALSGPWLRGCSEAGEAGREGGVRGHLKGAHTADPHPGHGLPAPWQRPRPPSKVRASWLRLRPRFPAGSQCRARGLGRRLLSPIRSSRLAAPRS